MASLWPVGNELVAPFQFSIIKQLQLMLIDIFDCNHGSEAKTEWALKINCPSTQKSQSSEPEVRGN